MADPFTWVAIGSTLLGAAGTMQQASAANQAGKDAQAQSEFVARQQRVQAGQQRATGQRGAIEARRKGNLVQSSFINSGAGSDPTSVNLLGQIGKESEYNALAALFDGEDAARGLETQANTSLYEGIQARNAGKIKSQSLKTQAVGSLISAAGTSSFADKYSSGLDWRNGRAYSGASTKFNNGNSVKWYA